MMPYCILYHPIMIECTAAWWKMVTHGVYKVLRSRVVWEEYYIYSFMCGLQTMVRILRSRTSPSCHHLWWRCSSSSIVLVDFVYLPIYIPTSVYLPRYPVLEINMSVKQMCFWCLSVHSTYITSTITDRLRKTANTPIRGFYHDVNCKCWPVKEMDRLSEHIYFNN